VPLLQKVTSFGSCAPLNSSNDGSYVAAGLDLGTSQSHRKQPTFSCRWAERLRVTEWPTTERRRKRRLLRRATYDVRCLSLSPEWPPQILRINASRTDAPGSVRSTNFREPRWFGYRARRSSPKIFRMPCRVLLVGFAERMCQQMASTPSGAADGLLKLLSSSRFDIPEPFELAAALGLKSPRQGMEHGAWANRHQRSPKDGPRFNAGRGLRERASKGF